MTVQQEQLGNGLYLVAVTGRLDQQLSPTLSEQLIQAIDAGHHRLIVDLTEVNYINSGGLRTLVTAWRKARENQGDLVLCGLNAKLRDIFVMVGFDKVFSINPTREAACEALLHDGA